MKTHD